LPSSSKVKASCEANIELIKIKGSIKILNDINFFDKFSVSFGLLGVVLLGTRSDFEEELFSKLRAFLIILILLLDEICFGSPSLSSSFLISSFN
jgi:hypothetical protein